MVAYNAYPVLRDARRSVAIEFECASNRDAEAHGRNFIGSYEAAAVDEGQRLVKLMRARPKAD